MNLSMLQRAVREGRIQWRQHALQRMIERDISRDRVCAAILNGEIIEDYSADRPFPSVLLLAFVEGGPLHVVVALDPGAEYAYIITAYEPRADRFGPDFRTRR